jgi:fused signal recognition particle receptor
MQKPDRMEFIMAKHTFAENLKRLFGIHPVTDDSFFDDLTDSLVEGDIGIKTAMEIGETLKKKCRQEGITDRSGILASLYGLLSPYAKEITLEPEENRLSVYLVLGVNGVGKTTAVAKMAYWYEKTRKGSVILAAADTFRAAAIEQLQFHGEKIGVRVVAHQHGSDPGAVVFDAAEAVRSRGSGLVIVDTAGRLHNKENLVRELQKIDRIAAMKADPSCYKKLLVLDATTGQNGLRQAEVFHEAVGLDAIILTKYDSTARGGIAITAGKELSLPVAFVGTGETYNDFAPFKRDAYLAEFLGMHD